MKLYKIRQELEDVLVYDEEGQTFDSDRFESLKIEFEDKLEGCAAVMKNLRAESEAVGAEINRLQKRKSAIDNNLTQLKNYVKFELDKLNIKKIIAGIHKFRIQRNSQPTVEVLDVALVPEEFKERVIEVNPKKSDMAKHFKDTGEELPGTFITQNTHLRVV